MYDLVMKKLSRYNKTREFFVKNPKYIEVSVSDASAYLGKHGII